MPQFSFDINWNTSSKFLLICSLIVLSGLSAILVVSFALFAAGALYAESHNALRVLLWMAVITLPIIVVIPSTFVWLSWRARKHGNYATSAIISLSVLLALGGLLIASLP